VILSSSAAVVLDDIEYESKIPVRSEKTIENEDVERKDEPCH